MNKDKLKLHILETYITLRVGIAVISIAFPIILTLGGYLYADLPVQDSMSAYYHAEGFDDRSMRDWFVGILFAVGVFLYLYKGYSKIENHVLNVAGILALCIALVPMPWNCGNDCPSFSWHGFFAIAFFLAIGYVCVFCAKDTLYLIKDEKVRERFKRTYTIIGIVMVLSPLIAYLMTVIFKEYKQYTLYIEVVGIYTFATYWIVKSKEIIITESERHALDGTLEEKK